ncbi:MAG: hypothetical protein AAGF12_42360 [Myxococcota bacterium]
MVSKLLIGGGAAAALAAMVFLSLPTAEGQTTTRVAVGTDGHHANGVDRPVIRRALADELRALGGFELTSTRRARYVLRASVTELRRVDLGHGLQVDCHVNVLVTDGDGATVRAMLSGRAGVRGTGRRDRVEQAAIQAAIRGALRPLSRSLPRL